MNSHELAKYLLKYPDAPIYTGQCETKWISDITSYEEDVDYPIKFLIRKKDKYVFTDDNYYSCDTYNGEEKLVL